MATQDVTKAPDPRTPAPRRGGDVFAEVRREMDRLFEEMLPVFGRGGFPTLAPAARAAAGLQPSIDVRETDEALVVEAELPGMEEKDVEVRVSGGVLTISGERASEREEKRQDWHLRERSRGAFSRSFRLPDTVDLDRCAAAFDRGVLTVTLPKTETARAEVRRIPVQAGAGPEGGAERG